LLDVLQQITSLFQVAATTGVQVKVSLGGRNSPSLTHPSGVHENAAVVGIGETKLWPGIRFALQLPEFSIVRTHSQKNLCLINVDEWSNGASEAAMAPLKI
jgi:hypothetical protein